MSWMSKHATEHKKNLLDTMPIDDKGSALLKKGYATMGTAPQAETELKAKATASAKPVEEVKGKVSMTSRFKKVHEDNPIPMTGSPLTKGCAKSEGGSGCVKKRGSEYVIINNKKPGNQIWRSGFSSKEQANKVLAGYHANK